MPFASSRLGFWGTTKIIELSYPSVGMFYKGSNPAWGNNPVDVGSWPYAVWFNGQGEGGSGQVYYPFVAPGGDLYFTCGADNYGVFSYGIAPNESVSPTSLTYTNLSVGFAYPGVNSWVYMGNFSKQTIIWFGFYALDYGVDYGLTFAISTTPSVSGMLLNSRSGLTGNGGYPYYKWEG
jgi:hypothetical protein